MATTTTATTLLNAVLKTGASGGLLLYKDEVVDFKIGNFVDFFKADGTALTFPTLPTSGTSTATKAAKFYNYAQNGLAHTSDYKVIDFTSGKEVEYSLTDIDSTKLSMVASGIESILSDNISSPQKGRTRLAILSDTHKLLTIVKRGTRTRSFLKDGITSASAATFGDALKTLYVVNNGTLNILDLRSNTYGDAIAGQSIQASTQSGSVSCGLSHALFRATDGSIKGFGDNDLGQLGDGTFVDNASPVSSTGAMASKTVTKFKAAGYRSMALCSDGTLYGWGDNAFGQSGDGTLVPIGTPTAVTKTGALAGKTIVDFAISANHTIVKCSDGSLVAFGNNSEGQLGHGSDTFSAAKVLVDYPAEYAAVPITSISATNNHSTACTQTGELIMWGSVSATPKALENTSSIVFTDYVKLSCDSLPAGLVLSADPLSAGEITGAPTSVDDYNTIVKAQLTDFEYYGLNDSRNSFTSKGSTYFSLPIGVAAVPTSIPPLSSNIISATDRELVAGEKASIPLASSSTATIVDWEVSGLPQGLSFTVGSDAAISGTPVEAGTFNVKITLSYTSSYNGQILTSSKTVVFTVAPAVVPKINLVNRSIIQGSAQNIILSASDLFKAEEWQVAGLPTGLTVLQTGAITGTVVDTGTYPLTVTLLYKFSEKSPTLSTSKTVTLTVTLGIPEVTINSATQAVTGNGSLFSTTATTSRPFSMQINATNSPTTFTATGLPAGFAISATGMITGTPTTAGVYAVTLTASNAIGTSPPKYLKIEVAEVAVPAFLSNGGIDLFVDIQTRKLSLSPPKPETTLAAGSQVINPPMPTTLMVKSGETLLLNVRFTKGITPVDPDPATMRFGIAPKLGGALIMEGNTFTKEGSGTSIYFKMKISSVEAEFGSLINDYYDEDSVEQVNDLGSSALAYDDKDIAGVCELLMTVGGGSDTAEIRSDTMAVVIKKSLL